MGLGIEGGRWGGDDVGERVWPFFKSGLRFSSKFKGSLLFCLNIMLISFSHFLKVDLGF